MYEKNKRMTPYHFFKPGELFVIKTTQARGEILFLCRSIDEIDEMLSSWHAVPTIMVLNNDRGIVLEEPQTRYEFHDNAYSKVLIKDKIGWINDKYMELIKT